MPDNRYHQQGRHFPTSSQRTRAVKTPGGRIKPHHISKTTNGPKCSDCKISLPGIKHTVKSAYKNMKKRERTISRAYGGSCCATCVRNRIMRAFLLEEQKLIKKIISEKK
jgi:large subunit ribosomal protein L34e